MYVRFVIILTPIMWKANYSTPKGSNEHNSIQRIKYAPISIILSEGAQSMAHLEEYRELRGLLHPHRQMLRLLPFGLGVQAGRNPEAYSRASIYMIVNKEICSQRMALPINLEGKDRNVGTT